MIPARNASGTRVRRSAEIRIEIVSSARHPSWSSYPSAECRANRRAWPRSRSSGRWHAGHLEHLSGQTDQATSCPSTTGFRMLWDMKITSFTASSRSLASTDCAAPNEVEDDRQAKYCDDRDEHHELSVGVAGWAGDLRTTHAQRVSCSAHRPRSRCLIVGTAHAPNIWVWARDVGYLGYSWDSHARYW